MPLKYQYDLAAVVEQQKTEQIVSTGTNSHLAIYSYDHADRLLSVNETVAFGSKTKTVYTLSQRYNTLGQLQSKWVHAYATNQSKYRVKTGYTQNIRGWLTDGNTVYKVRESDPELAYYAFRVSYRNGSSYSNGNVDSLVWKGKDQATFNAGLTFGYDGADRLIQSAGITTGTGTYAETEGGISYDKNGNIKTLVRAGASVDNLTYTYTTLPGNRLKTANDGSGNNTGFKTGSLGDYSYDANGNMTYDINKQATIGYNYLDLPKTIGIGTRTLAYDYDASGTKHKYYDLINLNAADTINIKYAGIFEYDGNNALKRIITSNGQVQQAKVNPSPDSDTLRFDYFLKDHLGNVRVVLDESGKIIQQSDYYPFGLSIDRNSPATLENARNGVNRYLYNGKEAQVGTGNSDYGARSYIPEIGRWSSSDPLSEKSRRWSPFTYTQNNPLRYTDPDGRDIIRINGGVRFTGEDIGIAFNAVTEQIGETGSIHGIHFVEESKTPTIYEHTLNSFRKGKPSVLHYDSDKQATNKRRYQALKMYPLRGSEKLDRDEYPYASTLEGGTGANVAYVSSTENQIQGKDLGKLYRTLKSGDAFLVFPVPREREPETSPVPITQTKPLISPRDVGVGIMIGVGVYEALKWGGAIFLIPETGGASIPAAAALP